MSKNILIAAGGTGGHVFPAMALAEQMTQEIPGSQVLFVGGGLSRNRYFDQQMFAHRSVSCGTPVMGAPWPIVKSCYKIGKGILQSLSIIRDFRPDVAVGFGSFYSFPPLVAAKMMSVPFVLHEANSIPGKVNRLLSKYAAVSGVHFPQTMTSMFGKTVEVGMPLRSGFKHSLITKEEAKKFYGFSLKYPVILIFGGSQGSQTINELAFQAVKHLQVDMPLQVLHLTGGVAMADQLKLAYKNQSISAVVKPFENRMEMAWQVADLVICRAGAGTVAEQLEFEIPGILIPFPHATGNHQNYNANFMVDTVGGAKKILESELSLTGLSGSIKSLLEGEHGKMRLAMKEYKETARSCDLCSLVKTILDKS